MGHQGDEGAGDKGQGLGGWVGVGAGSCLGDTWLRAREMGLAPRRAFSRWSGHGVGWFVDVMDDAGVGHKMLHLYYGSSTYTRDEMRVLLDWLVDQAEQMGIVPRLSKEEEERVLAQWGKASCNQTNPAISAAG